MRVHLKQIKNKWNVGNKIATTAVVITFYAAQKSAIETLLRKFGEDYLCLLFRQILINQSDIDLFIDLLLGDPLLRRVKVLTVDRYVSAVTNKV